MAAFPARFLEIDLMRRKMFSTLFMTGVFFISLVADSRIPDVVTGLKATETEIFAATELQRYLDGVLGKLPELVSTDQYRSKHPAFILGTPESMPAVEGQTWPFGLEIPKSDGYILHAAQTLQGKPVVIVAAPTAKGVQNGVYGLLEKMGFGFYFDGDTFPGSIPDTRDLLNMQLHESKTPVFSVRGSLPWYNFFNSPTTWELADHKAFIDQLAKMRCNFLGFHTYDNEPFAAYEKNGRIVEGEPLLNTASPTWGTKPMKTHEFFAGTGQFFDKEYFGAAASFAPSREEGIREAKRVLRHAFEYAKTRGLITCLGFEINGDPFNPDVRDRFEARFKALLRDYPMLDYVWLWESESMGVHPNTTPAPRSAWESYTQRWSEQFSDVDTPERKAEAVRLSLFGLYAKKILEAMRPDVKLCMSGWGGDNWLKCSDFYPGMDKLLPKDVVFSALDNIRVTPKVSEAYGKLEPERQRWPIVWFEFDGDQWMPQPNLRETAGACRDALAKGCQGLLGIHWRTRGVEESAAYCAQFAWDPSITVEMFCERQAKDRFGDNLSTDTREALLKLQNAGYRWVGGTGQPECGAFVWSKGEEAKRADLAALAESLSDKFGWKKIWTEDLVSRSGYTNVLPKGILGEANPTTVLKQGLLPEVPILGMFDTILFGKGVKPYMTPTQSLLESMAYVLYYDRAANIFEPGADFDKAIDSGDAASVISCIKSSRLAEAMYAYAKNIRTKGELGVLATMNAKAWADIKSRTDLTTEQLADLCKMPENIELKPGLLRLPDRVILTGVNKPEKAKVVLKSRSVSGGKWKKTTLPLLGRTTYGVDLDTMISGESGGYEYGIEVSRGRRLHFTWPEGFPKETAHFNTIRPQQAMYGLPEIAQKDPVAPLIRAEIVPDRYCVRLTWESCSGEIYKISRDGIELSTVMDGWYEDMKPVSGKTLTYTVTAHTLSTHQAAASTIAVTVTDLPLPKPPEKIKVTTHASRIVLGWMSDSPAVFKYRVLRYNAKQELTEETFIEADFGHYLQISDLVEGGKPYVYTITPVTADGRFGQTSEPVGIISSTEPLRPILHLSFSDNSMLHGLARLADNALALGGRGWAELPPQPEWNPEHALTLALWVKLENLNGSPVLICKGKWQEAGYFLQALNNKFRFYMAGVDTLDAGIPQTGKWQHVAATYGFGEMRIFVNGELVGRKYVSGRPKPSKDPLLIGRYGANDSIYFVHGMMDDIRIYVAPMTQGEIKTLCNETKNDRNP